jgi:hypothetical protein
MNKNWKRMKDESGSQVYVHRKTGNIKVIYPKAPKWAQRAALRVFRDLQKGGEPTEKGIRNIVKGTWAYLIAREAKRG